MKTLHEIKEIENYLLGNGHPSSKLVFDARLLLDPMLALRMNWQRKLYSIITLSGRRKIKSEAERVHLRLFNDPAKQAFQQQIFQIFSKK